jgi:hypothetical protein
LRRSTPAWHFRTAIRDGYEHTPINFAGTYVAVKIGCGAPCARWTVVDARTGAVYFDVAQGSPTADFRVNSRLFVTDPPASNATDCDHEPPALRDLCLGRWTVYYSWDGHTLRPVRTERRS